MIAPLYGRSVDGPYAIGARVAPPRRLRRPVRGLGQDEFGMESFDYSSPDFEFKADESGGGGGGGDSFGVFDDGFGGFMDSQGNPVSSDGSQIDYAMPQDSWTPDIHAGDAQPASGDWIPYTDEFGNPAWYSSSEVAPAGIDTGVDISALPFGGSAIQDTTQLQATLPYQGYVDAGYLTPEDQLGILNGDITLEQALGLAPGGVIPPDIQAAANAAAAKKTASGGGGAAPSGGGSSGGGGGAKPAAGLTEQQLAAALAQLKQQLAQAQTAGNTAAAKQIQAQIDALGGGASWFTQKSVIAGVPNWAILAGGGALAFVLFGSGTQYEARSPLRRRNPHRAYRRRR
jgi:hypothetical protein